MKKSMLLLMAAISISLTQAQNISFGAKAGLNIASLSGSDVSGATSRVSFHIGGLAQIPLTGMLSLQPELVYSSQGAKINANGSQETLSLGYLNLPILLKYSTSVGVYFESGLQFGLDLSGKVSANGTSTDVKKDVNSLDVSWPIGAGYLTSMNLGFDARYNLGLTNDENKSNTQGTGTIKNGVFQIGVFYIFGSTKK
ncbi:MAG TPA: porin family protein [Puia sp.]|nr:porin family protein [Puia sp.]